VSETTVSCPYCLGDIAPQALACRHCTRDLSLFKPLMGQLQAQGARLDAMQAQLDSLAQSLAQVQQAPAHSQILQAVASIDTPVQAPPPGFAANAGLWLAPLLTVGVLSLAHWVFLFVYDTPVLYFRVITFFVPVLLGLWAGQGRVRPGWVYALLAVLAGVCSVASMLWITHAIDGVAWLPQDLREWRETVEYAFSIMLAFFTGHLAISTYSRWKLTRANNGGVKTGVLLLLQKDENGKLKLEQLSSSLVELATSLAPIFSGAMALYSGLKSVLGS
jgi:hypothetical protein